MIKFQPLPQASIQNKHLLDVVQSQAHQLQFLVQVVDTETLRLTNIIQQKDLEVTKLKSNMLAKLKSPPTAIERRRKKGETSEIR